jgi:SNF family Na+-dependent transporter
MLCDKFWAFLALRTHSKYTSVSYSLAGIGFCAVLVAFYVSFYYNVIIGWALYFLVASANPDLPWLHCNNTWNTEFCMDSQLNNTLGASNNDSANNSVDITSGVAAGSVAKKLHFSPASEYFQ